MVPYDCLDPAVVSERVSMPRVGNRLPSADSEDTAGAFPLDFEVEP